MVVFHCSRPRLVGTAAFVVVLLSACQQVPMLPGLSPYRIDIQQGNVVTQDMVTKLKPGMSRQQVRFVLGTPPIVDPFHQDRWDYVYYLNKGGKVVEYRRLVLLFDGDTLKRVHGDVVPTDSAPAAAAPFPANAASKPALTPTGPSPAGSAPASTPAASGASPAAADSAPTASGATPAASAPAPAAAGPAPATAAPATAAPSPAASGAVKDNSGSAVEAAEAAKAP